MLLPSVTLKLEKERAAFVCKVCSIHSFLSSSSSSSSAN